MVGRGKAQAEMIVFTSQPMFYQYTLREWLIIVTAICRLELCPTTQSGLIMSLFVKVNAKPHHFLRNEPHHALYKPNNSYYVDIYIASYTFCEHVVGLCDHVYSWILQLCNVHYASYSLVALIS